MIDKFNITDKTKILINETKEQILSYNCLFEKYNKTKFENTLESLEDKLLFLIELNAKIAYLKSSLSKIRSELSELLYEEISTHYKMNIKDSIKLITDEIETYKSSSYNLGEALNSLKVYLKSKYWKNDY